MKKNFVLTGINALNRLEFRDGAMALRVAFDDLVRVHSELHDPESIGSVFWSADSVVALLANDMGFVRISAPVGTPLHIVDGLRNMLLAFQGAAPDRIEIAESDDISVQSFIDGEGAIPTLNECHRALCEAIGRIR